MDTVVAIFVGLGLAAACGLRVFLPLLVTSVASHLGMIDLGPDFAWAGSWPAMVALGVAAAFEVGAYWVPWLDHALDLIAGPCAVIAGTLVAAAQFGEVEPMVKWASALIAGGGLAATVKATAMSIRAGSTATTAGIGNPVVSTVESLLAAAASVVAIIAPLVVGAVLALVVLVVGVLVLRRVRRSRRARAVKAAAARNIPLARPATVQLSRAA
ncbi:MAG: DUF4126 domain-containing protein [Phycisphaeraceae bacterium]|nr:DUF4126 domain-containing protein [Phycisphaeraceae bacterium]